MKFITTGELLKAIFDLFKKYFQEEFEELNGRFITDYDLTEYGEKNVEKLKNKGFKIEEDKDGKIIVKVTEDSSSYIEISMVFIAEVYEFKNFEVPISYVKRCLIENFADIIVFILIPLNLQLHDTNPQDLVKSEIDAIIGYRDIMGDVAINFYDKISINYLFNKIAKTILKVSI